MPTSEENQHTTGQGLPAPICSHLPILIHAGDAVTFRVGNQGFALEYSATDIESTEWMADQLATAFRNAGASVGITTERKSCEDCDGPMDNEFMTICKPCSIKRRDARLHKENTEVHTPLPARATDETGVKP